tara:strand:- start:214 stop:2103 length:1890 start_codon:yes stop_codon:yes gene_type:complete
MAYNSNLENKDINYLGKDFNSFKNNLSEFAKTYFPTIYNDFSSASPGTMFVELAAYVGDVLSYYMDSQIKENLLPYAKERANIVNIANTLGYKVTPTKVSKCKCNVFVIIPARSDGKPDWQYAPTLHENSSFKSTEANQMFTTDRDVKFSHSSSIDPTITTVYKINSSTSLPSFYLLKKSVNVTNGERKETTFTIGSDSQRFRKLELSETNVVEIESVTDSEGNTWHEVPYLAQETVFIERQNTSEQDATLSDGAGSAPYLLKMKKTSKRFTTRTTAQNKTALVFGSGISTVADELIIPNPENVGSASPEGVSKLDRAFDPSNFLQTNTYGQSPKNTTLTVRYKVGGGSSSNVSANTIKVVDTALWSADNVDLSQAPLNDVKNSIAVENPEAAQGGAGAETPAQIKRNALAYFNAQSRVVTREDYQGRVYAMPARYGQISKCYVSPDTILQRAADNELETVPNVNATNLYILGYDKNKNLTNVNQATKENLKQYLAPYRMLTDSIHIKNGFIVNIGVDFEIIPLPDYNSNEVLIKCMAKVRDHFNIDNWQFNEPITINKIITKLADTEGVQSVQDLVIKNKWRATQGYSGNKYDMDAATKNGIVYPPLDPSIFELKFPSDDITGRVSTY